jgi:hypothetical protein
MEATRLVKTARVDYTLVADMVGCLNCPKVGRPAKYLAGRNNTIERIKQ